MELYIVFKCNNNGFIDSYPCIIKDNFQSCLDYIKTHYKTYNNKLIFKDEISLYFISICKMDEEISNSKLILTKYNLITQQLTIHDDFGIDKLPYWKL